MEVVINNEKVEVEVLTNKCENVSKKLAGKSIEEQIKLLEIEYENYESKSSYGMENESTGTRNVDLISCDNILKIYLYNDVIVSVKCKIFGKEFDLELNKRVNTYFACEDDGPSERCVIDYATLVLKE